MKGAGKTLNIHEIEQHLRESAGAEWDGDRSYLGMSRLWMCPRGLFFEMKDGQPRPDAEGMLRCHEGYVHERDILDRLNATNIHLHHEGREIVAAKDGRIRGHVDGIIAIGQHGRISTPRLAIVEIKSVLCFDGRPVVPRHKDIEQVQAYMHFDATIPTAILIYKSRTSGEIKVFFIPYDRETGIPLEKKALSTLRAVDDNKAPSCECGRCRK